VFTAHKASVLEIRSVSQGKAEGQDEPVKRPPQSFCLVKSCFWSCEGKGSRHELWSARVQSQESRTVISGVAEGDVGRQGEIWNGSQLASRNPAF
jgi:hypothetical protein